MIGLPMEDENSFVFDDNFDSGGCRERSIQGNKRVRFQAQHDHMPTLPQRRSSHSDVCTGMEQDQRPIMPKRELSNRSLWIDVDVDEEDSTTVSSYESKGSAVIIAESLKSKPDSNIPPAFALVVSSKPFLPKPRQLPAQTEQSGAAITESLTTKPASNLPSPLSLVVSSKPVEEGASIDSNIMHIIAGTASMHACSSEEYSSTRKSKKEKQKKSKSMFEEKKSSKYEKEGDISSSKAPSPRAAALKLKPRHRRRLSRPSVNIHSIPSRYLTRSQKVLLLEQRSAMNVRQPSDIFEALTIVLEDTAEEEKAKLDHKRSDVVQLYLGRRTK